MTGEVAGTTPLERGLSFLEAHGDALALARAEALQGESAALAGILEARRRPGGGFCDAAGSPSATLGGARELLDLLDEAGLRSGPLAESAALWLAGAQQEDGSWRAEDRGDDGVLETGRIAGQLAKLRCGSARTLRRAEAFLDAAFSPDRVEAGGWPAILAFALPATNGLLACADEALQWCGRALEKGWRSGGIGAADALRTLLLCDAPALPGARVGAGELVLAIVADQAEDGGFGAAADPTPDRVETTLLAVRGLRRFAGRGAAPASAPG